MGGAISSSTVYKEPGESAEGALKRAHEDIVRLREETAKRHTLSLVVYTTASMSTASPSSYDSIPSDQRNPFRLDDKPVSIKWTKSGLRVGCHTITREALEALAKLEE